MTEPLDLDEIDRKLRDLAFEINDFAHPTHYTATEALKVAKLLRAEVDRLRAAAPAAEGLTCPRCGHAEDGHDILGCTGGCPCALSPKDIAWMRQKLAELEGKEG